MEVTASDCGEGALGEDTTLLHSQIHLGSLLCRKTVYIPFNFHLWLPSCHSKDSDCNPGTVLGVTTSPHSVKSTVLSRDAAQSPIMGSHQNLWQTGNWSKTPSMSNGVTEGASNGLALQQDTHSWVFLHFPNPSWNPIPEPGNGGEIQMASKGQVC